MSMFSKLTPTAESWEYYTGVVFQHNAMVQPLLLKAMSEIEANIVANIDSGTEFKCVDMGSRGFTWKVPTCYDESDFEIAIVCEPEHMSVISKVIEDYLTFKGVTFKSLITKAGLPYMVIEDYPFSGTFTRKFEICYQTPTQNDAIRQCYLTNLKSATLEQIAEYIYQVRTVKNDPVAYNAMKTWLRVL